MELLYYHQQEEESFLLPGDSLANATLSQPREWKATVLQILSFLRWIFVFIIASPNFSSSIK